MLDCRRIVVEIEGKTILHELDLEVRDGEVVAVLGPSGSGKTTLLRAVAGLTPVMSGDITWNGTSVLEVPTHERQFGLMFQGYALFPHMDVGRNIGFGLRMSGAIDTAGVVADALNWVGLDGFESRSIDSLSGGERQRVALARTLAPRPKLVMLDEPLGALDRNLRQRLLTETREILVSRRVTALVVTHDRDEAAALADRLALMRDGRIVQIGALDEILSAPADPWVAEFLG